MDHIPTILRPWGHGKEPMSVGQGVGGNEFERDA